jgi:AcrR family transcriptional regulator
MTHVDDRGRPGGVATRELMIKTAESLFAKKGVDAVSLREIGRASGQGNIAAAQFHFGDKAGLISAIQSYRVPTSDARRQDLLDEAEEQGTPDLDALMGTLLWPVADHVLDPDDNYISFQARLMATEANFGSPLPVPPNQIPSMVRLRELVIRALPGHPPEVVDRRLAMIIEWMIQSMARYERSMAAGTATMTIEKAVEDLMEVFAAALRARPV